ncbi:putative Ig domain-containing protein [Leptospira barantonii]|uniref:Lcl C-terminal domain-containing protein n=1 Tax=Leptospira barantonii TaxID=2023184 RepID=A0ABX4NK62_9LEPT|nr:putative Ig domain-containing protein [Leptospira barantonii]PJZ57200.1 hypothetical protein CH367_10715 [Leptospira barantonii]
MKKEKYRLNKSKESIEVVLFSKSNSRTFRKTFFSILHSLIFLCFVSCVGNGNHSWSFKGIFGPMNLFQSSNAPLFLNYTTSPFVLTKDVPIATIQPTTSGSINDCISSPSLPTGLSLDSNSCVISGTPTVNQPATSYTITASNASENKVSTILITVNMNPPAGLNFATGPFTFTVNSALTTINPTYTGTITSCSSNVPLPTGLSLGGSDCSLYGTPSLIQTAANYVITATNPFGSANTTISITVNAAPPTALNYAGTPFVFTQNATIGTITPTYTGTVTACNSDITLPAGLALDSVCQITGTPNTLQTATDYTITASNAYGNTTFQIKITVNLAPPSALSYTGGPFVLTENSTVTLTPTVTGTVTSCTSGTALPTGLAINATTCVISGTPTVTQTATNYTITASNAYGSTTDTISLAVNAAAPSGLTYTPTNLTFYKGVNTSISPTVTGTVTSCTSGSTLPNGLSINSTTCAISGTPTSFQTGTNYTITASNSSGSTNASINILIYGNAPIKTMQNTCWNTAGTLDATCAAATSNGQDGKLQKGVNASFTNQTVNGNEYIVTDNNTGLIWTTCHFNKTNADCSGGTTAYYNLTGATNACIALNALNSGAGYANRTTWRLPTISEIETLVDFNVGASPRTFTTAFPGTSGGYYYWSSTLYLPDTTKSLVLYFSDGGTTWTDNAPAGSVARCVSTGP